ncbi:MAG: hypothetical protein LKJ76_09690 [Lachnospiraceae bacterium]|nr:hypothetical protein [Lachnospiraceae bacterium]
MSETFVPDNNTSRFLNSFAVIEEKMNEILHPDHYISFAKSVSLCAAKNRVIRENQSILGNYRQLRNTIVHQRDAGKELVAAPTEETADDIERIANELTKPVTVLECAVTPIRIISSGDAITAAFDKMRSLGSTKIPCFDSVQYKGLLTAESLAYWCCDPSKDRITTVSQVMELAPKEENVEFLAADHPAYEILHVFGKAMDEGRELQAIIVTESGGSNEIPLGIITLKDLPNVISRIR